MAISLPSVGKVSAGRIIAADGVGRAEPESTELIRENAALLIGLLVVVIFGFAVVYLFHLGALLFTKFNAVETKDFPTFVRDALNPFLKECATTLGTIFGSTLGFVFGYYFKAASNAFEAAKSRNA